MPEVPDHLGHGGYSGSPFWLAIGPTAAEALRAHGASFFETDAPAIEEVDDVIGALVLLSHRRALGCVVSGSVLDTRPRDALENLRREIQPGPRLIPATGTENPAVRVAARELGIHVWEASPHGAETLTATATEDGPTEPPPREGHVADRNAPRRSPASARRSSRTDVPPRGADRGEPLRAEPPYPEPPYPEARARRSAPLDAPEDGEPPATA
ncbi:MAG: hypothetical protein P1V36_17130, partial [Planctomycetota bacterium]|nr:hypothetical protein [Planctomycetota bacterium]